MLLKISINSLNIHCFIDFLDKLINIKFTYIMKKFINECIKIILSTLILFVILNFIITLVWPIYLKIKFKDYKPYSSEIIEQLKMSEEDALQL